VQAASTTEEWSQQLQSMPATGLAALLICSQRRYDRLQLVIAQERQGSWSLQSVLKMVDSKFESKVASNITPL
jgi:hypothetical protein